MILKSLTLLITLALLLTACSGGTALPSATIPPSATASPSSTPEPTASSTSTLTPSPTPTATLTPPASLEPEQARETIEALLREPVDCAAPCFWGIMPGQTQLGEAKNIFIHFGLQSEYTTTLEDKDFYEVDYGSDTGLSLIVLLTVQNETVENLRIHPHPEKQKTGVPREWLAYSPETLIERYGVPSRVNFVLDWGPRPFFEMDMYFDAVDMIVEYDGHDIIPRQKGSPRVCPLTDQYEGVGLWMGKDPYYPPRGGVPLEKATSMTLQEFADLMTGDPTKACFVINGEVFP